MFDNTECSTMPNVRRDQIFDETEFRIVLLPFVSFRFVSFHFVSFRFVSFRFDSIRFVSFRFVCNREKSLMWHESVLSEDHHTSNVDVGVRRSIQYDGGFDLLITSVQA